MDDARRWDPVFTRRLALTPVGPQDVDDLLVLYGDPEVAYWTGPWTPESIAVWARDMAGHWATDGVGKWMARDRVDGTLIGRGGFTCFDLAGEAVLELGWAVRDAFTGLGYATEIGQAALDWASEHEPSTPVISYTEQHNHASQAVMRRLGLLPAGVIHRTGLVEGRAGLHPDAPFALHRLPRQS